MEMAHYFVVSSAAQSHINPAFRFAVRLAATGARVTFSAPLNSFRRTLDTSPPDGISFAPFSDGYDEGCDVTKDGDRYMEQLKRVGFRSVSDVVQTLSCEGRPVTCLVYSILLPWAADVAREWGIPSALLWIQPAAVYVIYHHFFHGHESFSICSGGGEDKCPSSTIELPGLSLVLHRHELPSFVIDPEPFPSIFSTIQELFQSLDREEKPRVLVNTFDALEEEALRAVDTVEMAAVGPLIPLNESSFDLFKKTKDSVKWLDSKPKSSVIYIAFGTFLNLSQQQIDEISKGLVETGRPFLWVIRESESGPGSGSGSDSERKIEGGLVVPWCSQTEVLLHPSVGCFVTHCGWNSTMESISSGVPMVCFPKWSDQELNAKLIEEVWKTGVRVKVDEDGVLGSGELKRCLEMVMGGEKGEDMKKNAVKWKDLAMKAAGEGGSSHRNIVAFSEQVEGCGFC